MAKERGPYKVTTAQPISYVHDGLEKMGSQRSRKLIILKTSLRSSVVWSTSKREVLSSTLNESTIICNFCTKFPLTKEPSEIGPFRFYHPSVNKHFVLATQYKFPSNQRRLTVKKYVEEKIKF